jgi:hypothetical protein
MAAARRVKPDVIGRSKNTRILPVVTVSFEMREAVLEMTRTADISVGSGKKKRPERRWMWGAAELKRFQWLMGWIGLLTLLPLTAGETNENKKHTDDNFSKQ